MGRCREELHAWSFWSGLLACMHLRRYLAPFCSQELLTQADFHGALLHCALEVVTFIAHEVGFPCVREGNWRTRVMSMPAGSDPPNALHKPMRKH